MEAVYCKNYFSLIKIFVLRLFKITVNQTDCYRLEGWSSKFWWLKSGNIVKFTEECVVLEEHVSVKKMFMNGLNMGLQLSAYVKKTVYGVETHRLSSKEKVLGTAGHADILLGYERIHHYRFPLKGFNC